MTPDIKPFLLEADRRRPDLRVINTSQAAFDLLQLTLALAGPEWAHVAKTKYDGSQVTPVGFVPVDLDMVRPDGQRERVRVTGVSQDAAWHVPTHQQIKVIAFSAANDPGPWEHGPAQLTPYPIDPVNYRWHNPPVPQFGNVVVPPVLAPVVVMPAPAIKPRQRFFDELGEINAFYAADDGLQRVGGMMKFDEQGRPIADVEALGAWGYNLLLGATVDECKAQIRNSDEWKGKHR